MGIFSAERLRSNLDVCPLGRGVRVLLRSASTSAGRCSTRPPSFQLPNHWCGFTVHVGNHTSYRLPCKQGLKPAVTCRAEQPVPTVAPGTVGGASAARCSQGLPLFMGSAAVSSGGRTYSLQPGHPVPSTQTAPLFWELFWTPTMDLTTQKAAASMSTVGPSTRKQGVTVRFYPHAPRPKMLCHRGAKDRTRSQSIILSPLMAHQIGGESTRCPQHTWAQSPGISQPVPFSSPQK